MRKVTLSIVSHGQWPLVKNLILDIARYQSDADVVVTCNVPEPKSNDVTRLPSFYRLDNAQPRGFGSNHNAAFQRFRASFYCVANPDLRLMEDPLPQLLACMEDPKVGLVTPRVLSPVGEIEDSVRYFPTPVRLFSKVITKHDGRYPVSGSQPLAVDWAAGMFMLFREEAFREIGGFDEKFFLYYEDVDICARLWNAGWKVIHHPGVSVVHAAQRSSRKQLRYFRWHAASMARYFWKHWGRLPGGGGS